MLKVRSFKFEDLTDAEKESVVRDKYATYIKVTHGGKTILLESDAMDLENATFARDLNWIYGIIDEAYALGREDGLKSNLKTQELQPIQTALPEESK